MGIFGTRHWFVYLSSHTSSVSALGSRTLSGPRAPVSLLRSLSPTRCSAFGGQGFGKCIPSPGKLRVAIHTSKSPSSSTEEKALFNLERLECPHTTSNPCRSSLPVREATKHSWRAPIFVSHSMTVPLLLSWETKRKGEEGL